MATLSIRLPDSQHRHLKDLAKKEKVSINQLVSTAVAASQPPRRSRTGKR